MFEVVDYVTEEVCCSSDVIEEEIEDIFIGNEVLYNKTSPVILYAGLLL